MHQFEAWRTVYRNLGSVSLCVIFLKSRISVFRCHFSCISGKYTAAHMMVGCRSEMPVTEDGIEVKHPGLALILRHKPDLELQDLEKSTPLVLAARAKTADIVKMLVRYGLLLALGFYCVARF